MKKKANLETKIYLFAREYPENSQNSKISHRQFSKIPLYVKDSKSPLTNAVEKALKFDKNTSPRICLQQELTLDYI